MNEFYRSQLGPLLENPWYHKMMSFTPTVPAYTLNRDKLVHGVAKRTDQGDYILLTQTPLLTHLEASKNVPLLAYGGNKNTGIGFLKIFQLGFDDENLDEYTYLHSYSPSDPTNILMQEPLDPNISNVVNGAIMTPSYVPDVRVFDWLSGTADSRFIAFTRTTPSGIYNEHQIMQDVVVSGVGVIYIVDYNNSNTYDLTAPIFTSWQTLEVEETAQLTHLETTNYQDIPYVFASTDDIPARFFEKEKMDSGEINTFFEEYNTNIPNAKITCIRCDDRM
jgi:hypothetical protein